MTRFALVPVLALLVPAWLPGQEVRAPAPDLTAEVTGANDFALRLYGQLRRGPGNLLLSPFSVRVALAMTHAGAGGQTATQMEEVLALSGKREEVAASLGALTRGLSDPKTLAGCELRLANALWGQEGQAFRPDFVGLLREGYRAGFRTLDFGAPDRARAVINEWVSGQTDERIPELLHEGDLPRGVVLVLTNAILFRGTWKDQFKPEDTRERVFFVPVPDGEAPHQVKVPTMSRHGEIAYFEDATVQVLELPYSGDALSMVFVLPRERDGLAAVEASLSERALADRVAMLKPRTVSVSLPRFTVDTRFHLPEALTALGMRDAFAAGVADFSGMTLTRDVWIGDVIHQARVEIDEKGTEAAAATAVLMKRGGGTFFRADHPFLFLIRDRRTGTILFLGRVVDPTKPS